jgi:hypothetical protein
VLSTAAIVGVSATAIDPFAFFRPSIAVSADDRRELDSGLPDALVAGKGIFATHYVNAEPLVGVAFRSNRKDRL